MGIPEAIARMRYHYHSNMIDFVNGMHQLGLSKNKRANALNKHHFLVIAEDILPRIYGKEAVEKALEEL